MLLLNLWIPLCVTWQAAGGLAIDDLANSGLIGKTADGYVNMVYFPSWVIYQRGYEVINLPASDITHVLYAFAIPGTDGTVSLDDVEAGTNKPMPYELEEPPGYNVHGNVKQLYTLKQHYRHIKILLSIGGWGARATFSKAASSIENRQRFAKTAVGLMKDLGMDGLDLDWEYPGNTEEADNLTELLREVRDELDKYSNRHAAGHHFLLTIAAPAGSQNYHWLNMAKLDTLLDYVHLMGYDFAGDWEPRLSGHASNLYSSPASPGGLSVHTAVQYYKKHGITPRKLVLGMPLYGRSFQNTEGLGQPFEGVGKPDMSKQSWESGVWYYKGLPREGAELRFDNDTMAHYTYDNKTKELITFETPETVRIKTSYLKKEGLGGSMFWEAAGDRNDPGSLLATSRSELINLETTDNHLDYPDSKYDNVKRGMKPANTSRASHSIFSTGSDSPSTVKPNMISPTWSPTLHNTRPRC